MSRKLEIIVPSTRPGRAGLPVANWFTGHAAKHAGFEPSVTDLLELGLPFFDEPEHPSLGRYHQPHTKSWSDRVSAADAFVFVMPEYNHGFNAPLKNAIDYLHREWSYKPAGFVSYGGLAAGTRAVQLLKPILIDLRIVPVVEAVNIAFVQKSIDSDGRFHPDDRLERAADAMLDELARLEAALRPLRSGRARGDAKI